MNRPSQLLSMIVIGASTLLGVAQADELHFATGETVGIQSVQEVTGPLITYITQENQGGLVQRGALATDQDELLLTDGSTVQGTLFYLDDRHYEIKKQGVMHQFDRSEVASASLGGAHLGDVNAGQPDTARIPLDSAAKAPVADSAINTVEATSEPEAAKVEPSKHTGFFSKPNITPMTSPWSVDKPYGGRAATYY